MSLLTQSKQIAIMQQPSASHNNNSSVATLPVKRPCRNYKISQKIYILDCIKKVGLKEAARLNQVPLTTLYGWLKKEQYYKCFDTTAHAARRKLGKGLVDELTRRNISLVNNSNGVGPSPLSETSETNTTILNPLIATPLLIDKKVAKEIQTTLARARALFPLIELKLAAAVESCNKHGLPLRPSILRTMMIMLVNNSNDDGIAVKRAEACGFTASNTWLKGFMKRFSLSHRVFTTSHNVSLQNVNMSIGDSQSSPDDHDTLPDLPVTQHCNGPSVKALIPIPNGLFQQVRKDCTDEKARHFFMFLSNMFIKQGLLPEAVWNFDEIPVNYDLVSKKTIAKKGAKTVFMATTGSTHLRFTVGLTVNARGMLFIVVLCFFQIHI